MLRHDSRYTVGMSRMRQSPRRTHLIHWMVLWALIFGQLSLGLNQAIAGGSASADIRMPVCTIYGTQFVTITIDAADQSSDTTPSAADVKPCVYCSIAGVQVSCKPLVARFYREPHSVFIEQANDFCDFDSDIRCLIGAPRAPPFTLWFV
jgi:hypothetical protein